jgi:hypothetical protein
LIGAHYLPLKEKIMRILILIFCLVAQHSLYAQEIIRATALTGFDDPSQYNFVAGATYNLAVTLLNESDDDEFQEDLSVLYLTDKMIDDATPPAILVPEAIVTVPPLGTVDLPVTGYPINPNNFRVGGNIVVIWPSYSAPAIDSLNINVNVADTSVVGMNDALETLAKSQFSMKHFESAPFFEAGVKKLWLVASDGRTIADFKAETEIDLSQHKAGFYMLCMVDKQGRLYVVKHYHQP